MPISICKAGLDNVNLLAQMNDRLVEDQGSQNPFSLTELENRFVDWLQTEEYQIDLIFEQEHIIGYAVYQQRSDYYYPDQQVIYVRHFYIEREYRNQGLGQAAFELLIEARFPKDIAIALDAVATNPIGQNFWIKLGFTPYFIAMKRQTSGG